MNLMTSFEQERENHPPTTKVGNWTIEMTKNELSLIS